MPKRKTRSTDQWDLIVLNACRHFGSVEYHKASTNGFNKACKRLLKRKVLTLDLRRNACESRLKLNPQPIPVA